MRAWCWHIPGQGNKPVGTTYIRRNATLLSNLFLSVENCLCNVLQSRCRLLKKFYGEITIIRSRREHYDYLDRMFI